MDKLTLRQEAARIAAQVDGVTTRNFIATARRIERYITGSARLPEYISMEDVTRETVRRALNELSDANDAIRSLGELEAEFYRQHPEALELPVNNRERLVMATGAKHDVENMKATQDIENLLHETAPGTPSPRSAGHGCPCGEHPCAPCIAHPSPVDAVDRQHDPTFIGHLMKTFTTYPAQSEELNRVARHRQEIYHDLGLEPQPLSEKRPHLKYDTMQGMAYLAPGGIPSSEGERIFLSDEL